MMGVKVILVLSLALSAAALRAIPNAYFVELEPSSELTPRATSHSSLYSDLDAAGVKYTVRTEYNIPDLFVGAAIDLADASHYAGLISVGSVKRVKPVHLIPRPEPVSVMIPDAPSPELIARDGFDGRWYPPYLPDTESTHVMTGVNKLHAEGLTGRGIKIGIIDTGTDYTNPWLGGCFGPGCKVALGWDLVGDAYNGTNTPMPDPDPLDQCAGHGSHVAGIIGANPGNVYNISGVAYDATLASYRVFGCADDAGEDVIIHAMLMAYDAHCDVINLSLGGVQGWTSSYAGVIASKLADKGMVVVISAGNDGQYGAWYASDPADGQSVVAAASVDNVVTPLQNFTLSDGYGPVPYYQAVAYAIDGPMKFYVTSFNTSNTTDACNPLPDDTPDLSNYVTLVRRGTCAFLTKAANVEAKGAKYILVYDNLDESSLIGITGQNQTIAMISQAAGVHIVNTIASGVNLTATFPQNTLANLPNPSTGGLISTYSSIGPTYDMFFKPAVAAPGGNIFSTYPVNLGTFAVLSGTSMSSPFVTGSVALLIQAKGRSPATAAHARELLETTSKLVPASNNNTSVLQTAAQQGAGLISAYNAVHYTTLLTPGELLLNDTANFKGEQSIKVSNAGFVKQVYSVSHVPAATVLTYNNSLAIDSPLPFSQAAASVHITPTTFTLFPGEALDISLKFTPPKSDDDTYPVYSGFIVVKSHVGEELHSSYIGVAGSLSAAHIIDNTDTYWGPGYTFPLLTDANENNINYTDLKTEYFTMTPDDQPTLNFRFLFGTVIAYVDLVSASLNLQRRGKSSFRGLPLLGNILELDDYPRSSSATDAPDNGYYPFQWNGTCANGSYAANGEYKMLLRALKVTGDPSNDADWEAWLSPIFGVNITTGSL
ncbi:subtilisin-like protease [Dacryopinax primogenitus]|uniref:Subtilisin-like protease n=1 Tax=Dacryopinax primogenitus (strain DJM 731) TaxID=1858805 RepID=M5G1T3_DACPD|nr:subtilisin-like protease [Dacryopinax primogenitus]EJU04161.1 subtilisin-like protease [Dacryopinax primogenitus]